MAEIVAGGPLLVPSERGRSPMSDEARVMTVTRAAVLVGANVEVSDSSIASDDKRSG